MSAAGGAGAAAGGGAQQKRHTPVPPPGKPSGGPKAPPWENLMKMLECTVCFEMMEGSIFQCEQGHCLCSVCYGRLAVREDTGCPTCSAVLGQIRCRFAEEVREYASPLPSPLSPLPSPLPMYKGTQPFQPCGG